MSDPNLTLHYDFAADKSLAPRIGPTLAITRATSATFFDAGGILQTAASGVARFEYDPVTRISKGLLVEEARTNIALQSEDFSTTWVKGVAGDALNVNQAVAPDGTTTMDELVPDTTSTRHDLQQTFTSTAAAHTFSCFVKDNGAGFVVLRHTELTVVDSDVWFDLVNGVVATEDVGSTGKIEDVGGGVFRCSNTYTYTAGGATDKLGILAADTDNVTTMTGDDAIGIFCWGAQIEVGDFPTSYIPTTTVSVTRNADVVSTTDLTWLNTAEGTLFTDIIAPSLLPGGSGTPFIIAIDDGTAVDRILHTLDREPTEWDVHAFLTAANVNTVVALDTTINAVGGDRLRVANAWKANDHALSVNGNTSILDATVTVPVGLTVLRLGEPGETLQLNTHYREVRYYNVRKNNTFLESLSNGIINEDSINLSSNLANSTARKLARPY